MDVHTLGGSTVESPSAVARSTTSDPEEEVRVSHAAIADDTIHRKELAEPPNPSLYTIEEKECESSNHSD